MHCNVDQGWGEQFNPLTIRLITVQNTRVFCRAVFYGSLLVFLMSLFLSLPSLHAQTSSDQARREGPAASSDQSRIR